VGRLTSLRRLSLPSAELTDNGTALRCLLLMGSPVSDGGLEAALAASADPRQCRQPRMSQRSRTMPRCACPPIDTLLLNEPAFMWKHAMLPTADLSTLYPRFNQAGARQRKPRLLGGFPRHPIAHRAPIPASSDRQARHAHAAHMLALGQCTTSKNNSGYRTRSPLSSGAWLHRNDVSLGRAQDDRSRLPLGLTGLTMCTPRDVADDSTAAEELRKAMPCLTRLLSLDNTVLWSDPTGGQTGIRLPS